MLLNNRDVSKRQAATEMRSAVLEDIMWSKAKVVVEVLKPICEVLDRCNSDKPATGKIYWWMFDIEQKMETLVAKYRSMSSKPPGIISFMGQVAEVCRARWTMLHTNLQAVGYCLDPEHVCDDITSNAEVMMGLDAIIDKMATSSEMAANASRQLVMFRQQLGAFGSAAALENAKVLPGWQWWDRYGYHCQDLKYIATRVLSQVVSATSCERCWSAMGFVHSHKCNWLMAE